MVKRRKDKPSISIIIGTGNGDFVQYLDKLIDSSITKSMAKWGIESMSSDDINLVKFSALKQLEYKVSATSGTRWSVGEDVSIFISDSLSPSISLKTKETLKYDSNGNITSKALPESLSDVAGFRNGNKWILRRAEKLETGSTISLQMSDEEMTITEIGPYFLDSINKWLDTAVLYGVGSYAS